MTVSVLITDWHSNGNHLRRCIHALERACPPQAEVDAIVVSRSKLTRFVVGQGPDHARYPASPHDRQTVGEALNAARQQTASELIACLHATAAVDDYWFRDLVASFTAHPSTDVIAGAIEPVSLDSLVARAVHDYSHIAHVQSATRRSIRTVNAAFRRHALTRVGGFAHTNDPIALDVDLSDKLKRHHASIKVLRRAAMVYHDHPQTLAEFGRMKLGRDISTREWVEAALAIRTPSFKSAFRKARQGAAQPDITTAAVEAVLESTWRNLSTSATTADRVKAVIERRTPPSATVAVMTHGDNAYFVGQTRTILPFPFDEDYLWLPSKPAHSAEALEHLARARDTGADFLVVPQDCAWWLEFYREFGETLMARNGRVWTDATCSLFRLR